MTQRRAKVIRPTKLVVSDDIIAAFAGLGVPAQAFPEIVAREQAKGTTQEEFDAGLVSELETGRKQREQARLDNEKAEAERKATERQANRTALAGMALQGLLSGTTAWDYYEVARKAAEYADALLWALDTTGEGS